jgi:hypothetical protein
LPWINSTRPLNKRYLPQFSETDQCHNLEVVGWLTRSTPRAQEIAKKFSMAVDQGLFRKLSLTI